ncbi:proline-, glutamic acid- and leucine-rich protein 1 [Cotesia typhae]|uniref:proline-, glutamic acid- and leucine-rich protein 1 n=1 Tax=Cotesia typhae TaxID=2053667 RepID=UPI003D692085
MAKLLDLVNSVNDSVNKSKDFTINLLTSSSDLPFLSDEINDFYNLVVSKINLFLNKPDTRVTGVVILSKFLPRCSKDVLLKYGTFWISKVVQVLESNYEPGELSLACRVLGELLIVSKQIPELAKEISIHNIKPLAALITSFDINDKGTSLLYPLAILLHYYKESAEKFQASIRELILPTIDSQSEEIVQAGANIFTLLTRATERSFKPIESKPSYTNWTYNLLLICNSLDEILDTLFNDRSNNSDEFKLKLPSISEENVLEYYFKLQRRFENLCVFLSTMLHGCGENNSVIPNDILNLVERGFNISPSSLLKEDSVQNQILYIILPKLHVSLFNVLNAFIEGFKDNLVPFANEILPLYKHTLNWTNESDNQTIGGKKPFTNVRLSAYKSLKVWMRNLNGLSGVEIICDDIIPWLLKDITPEKSQVLLTIKKTTATSKKAFKRTRDNQIKNDLTLDNSTRDKESIDADLCKEALHTLQNIFKYSCLIKLPLYKVTEELIISLLYNVYMDSSNFYRQNPECHLQLLRTLKTMQMNPHPLGASSLHHCIELFSSASRENNLQVVEEAKEALMQLEKISHPSAPTLSLPVLSTTE